MLIRKPVSEVFEAIVNPDLTTKFWFTKSSGRLEEGKQVQWEWEMYGISIPVNVRLVERNKRIVIEWPGRDQPGTVECVFTTLEDGSTFVSITNSGFTGSVEQIAAQVADATQGFTLVLAGLKALLEFNVSLNLVADRYPRGVAHP